MGHVSSSRRWSEPPRPLLSDWRFWYGLGVLAALLTGGLSAGWIHAPTAGLLALIGLIVCHGIVLGLSRVSESPRVWLRSSFGTCAVLLLSILCEHEDAGLASIFGPLLAFLLWLLVPAGWLLFAGKCGLHAFRRSAPDAWRRGAEVPLRPVLASTAAFCGVLLLLHMWPGVVHGSFAQPAYLLTFGSLALAWTYSCLEPWFLSRLGRGSKPRLSRSRILAVLFAVSLLGTTTGLLWFGTLRRGLFLLCLDRFEALTAATTAGEAVPPRWIGPWHIEEAAVDPRGGVYLCTWRNQDWVDTLSYGFVYRPNQEGSPYGAAHYWLVPLTDDWWIFRASNDWF